MRYVVLFALLAVACGPSAAERAFEVCQRQMEAKNWAAAVSACGEAVRLEPKNNLYVTAHADAFTAQYRARFAEINAQAAAKEAAVQARNIARALQDQADTMTAKEIREHTQALIEANRP